MAVVAKARVAQLIGCRSITAAAEGLVTFERCAYRLKARLFKLVGLKCGSGGRREGQAPPLRRYLHQWRWLSKARRSRGTAAVAIFANPGPSGPGGIAEATQILRAGRFLPGPRGNPRNRGSRGWAAWRQGRQSRSCRLRPPLGGSLVPFCPGRKELAAGAAKYPLKRFKPASASNTSRYKTAHTERPPRACRYTRWYRPRRPPRGPGR